MNHATVAERGNSYTLYTVKGSLQDVFRAIECLFSEYDPRGYSTRVRSIDMEMNGSYTAKVWRANSAD